LSSHYQQLAADPKVQKKDLSFIHNYAAGGDAISLGAEKTVNEFLASHNVEYPMAKGYGMTEVASAATVAAGKNNKPGSVGIPMVNTLVSAFEPGTDKELPIGQRGELCRTLDLYLFLSGLVIL
jgi:long-chain acyl-CoA synthetase